MQELSECLKLHDKIRDENDRLEEIKSSIKYPKGQGFSDNPRVSSGSNPIENYLVLKENCEEKIARLETKLADAWKTILIALKKANVGNEAIHLFFLRYNCGFQWGDCAIEMKRIFGDKWNVNRVFRIHRQTVEKLQNQST